MRHRVNSSVELFSDDSFDGSPNQVAVNSTIEQTSMKSHNSYDMERKLFQVQYTNRLKRDLFDWIGRAVKDSTNWVSNATEDAVHFMDYVAGIDTITQIGQVDNDTRAWAAQTAIDRDILMFNATENTVKWTDDVRIDASKWTNGTVYHCNHKFIRVQVVVGRYGDVLGGVMEGGPTGAATKAVKHCVESVIRTK